MTPDDERTAAVAGIIVVVASFDGLQLDQAEVVAALKHCPPDHHEPCEVVALVHRRAEEQGVAVSHLEVHP